MAFRVGAIFCLVVLLHMARCDALHSMPPFNRTVYPKDFVFGAGSAAYQIEGGAREGGKGPSSWDNFTHAHPEKIWDHSNGDVAIDFFHRYKEDIRLLKEIGVDSFRLSISWSRILPSGKITDGVNPDGIQFYNDVFSELLANGIIPFVTLFHWDPPQALEDEYGGFLHPNIVNDFRDYADVCFKEFGKQVVHWTTLNEPFSYSMNGYVKGTFAPGRCSNYVGNCSAGNSGTEPYIVAHNLLLAHAAAVKLYREKYQESQKGEIGITLVTNWFVPKENTMQSLKASRRVQDFFLGWFLHPIVYGDYPPSMRAFVGQRLPRFTEAESKLVLGSMDFLGINYYTTNYVSPALQFNRVNVSYITDPRAIISVDKNGVPICPPSGLDWLFVCPKGIRELVLYVKEEYKNPPVYITENGYADQSSGTVEQALEDGPRIKYHESHLWFLQKAIGEGANVKGYFVWSFFDNFEWDAGYTVRFGIIFVDFNAGLRRIPKQSALWFKKFLLK